MELAGQFTDNQVIIDKRSCDICFSTQRFIDPIGANGVIHVNPFGTRIFEGLVHMIYTRIQQ